MKTTIAIIRLVLRTNKVLSTGEHPIMLRCSFHGMKEVSTGYSCSIKYWDKKNECIKKGYPGYLVINQELKKLKDAAISKRDRYIASDEVYSPSMVLDTSDRYNAVTNDLNGLIKRYIEDRGLENKTIEKWHIIRRNVEQGDNIPLIDLECRYYSARHSYIMGEIQKPGVNLLRLATVTGKSVKTLHQYLSYLGDLDLVE